MKKLTFTLLLTLMAIFSAQAAKVYLKIGEGQVTAESNLAVWVWDDSNNFCTNGWPGDKLTEKETIGGADYFVYTVNTEGSYDMLFNNNQSSGTKQTKDIKGITGDCTFVLNNEWDGENWSYTKTEGAPGAETPESVETYTVKLAGNAYGTNWDAPVTFAYNAETKEYVYEETETAKLADYFKIDIPETKKWFKRDDLVDKNLSEASSDFVAMNDNSGDMKITDAADYDKITLTVKKEGETWKMKIVGEKTYTVQIKGVNYDNWGVNAPAFTYNAETGEYVYEETETAKLADYFKIDIPETKKWFKRDDLVDKNLSEASSDFVAMNDNSGDMKITDAADYDKITLTVKKEGETWKMKIVGEKTYTVQIKGVNYDNWGVNAPAFTYNAETGEYVYEETEETAKLADMFKIYVKEGDRWISNAKFRGALNNDLGYQDLNEGDVMKITDAADYDKITLTVKNDNGTWKLKIVGVKTDKVQIKGVFNDWTVADMVSNPNGTYTYEVEENMAALSEGFCIIINGVHYAGKIALDLDGDAVDLQGNPVPGDDLTLIAEGDVASVILTVAKDGDNWTVKAVTGKTSSVAGVDAAGVVIAVANGEIVVDGAQSVAVYTAAGALVSTDARTRVAAGLYIVRADNVVKKVIVK